MANIDGLSQGLQELRDSIAETAQAAPQIARNEIRREGRAYFRGAVVAAVITSLLVGIPLFLLAERLVGVHERRRGAYGPAADLGGRHPAARAGCARSRCPGQC